MRPMNLMIIASLLVFGGLSTACAQSGSPQQEEDRRERIDRLQAEINELQGAMKGAPPERQEELKKRIQEKLVQLKELKGRPPQDPVDGRQEKARRLEMHIRELEQQLDRKDLEPEKRRELSAKLDDARARMKQLHDQDRREDPFGQGGGRPGQPPGFEEGPHARGPHQAPDPELHKIHQAAMELERESMKLSTKLRGLPKDSPERSDLTAKLKESVTSLFDLREQARAREVEMIRKRLEELTQLLEKRKANRDAIIEKRVKQLSGEADELDW